MSARSEARMRAIEAALEPICRAHDDLAGIFVGTVWINGSGEDPSILSSVRSRVISAPGVAVDQDADDLLILDMVKQGLDDHADKKRTRSRRRATKPPLSS